MATFGEHCVCDLDASETTMFIDFLTPQVFDAIVTINILMGLIVAGRRFLRDLGRPLPDDVPEWARARYEGSTSSSSSRS